MLAAAVCGALVTGCGSGGEDAAAGPADKPVQEAKPLTEDELRSLLLTPADLGSGYSQGPATTDDGRYDDVSVQGCPSLEKLGQDVVQPEFASKAEAGFTYTGYGTDAALAEELYSDRPSVLSSKLRSLFDAYTACPSYTMTSGTTPIQVKVSASAAPKLGDEQFAYTSTLELPGGSQVVKTLAVREDNVAVVLVGAPAAVDRHIATAVDKVSEAR